MEYRISAFPGFPVYIYVYVYSRQRKFTFLVSMLLITIRYSVTKAVDLFLNNKKIKLTKTSERNL